KKQPSYAPWCGPQVRVKVGDRVVGHVHDGPKYKDFLVDDAGKEHDPEQIAELVWSYLERSGDARKIEHAFRKDSYQTTMSVVSINPVVVIMGSYLDASWLKQNRDFAHQKWFWRAQIQPNSDPPFRETLKWFSPDLNKKPIALTFSQTGVAQIALPRGG